MCFLREQKVLIAQQIGEIVMKEFVRYGARAWTDLKEPFRVPYIMMAEVD